MEVFEILQPGAFLVCPDEAYRQRANRLLGFMRQQFFDANEAVNLFVAFEPTDDLASVRAEMEERRPRPAPMEQPPDRESSARVEDLVAHTLEAMKQRKRERWARGHAPGELQAARQRICAQGFLYSVHMFSMLLTKLRDPVHAPALAGLALQMEAAFPELTNVRNSTQHADERVLGRHLRRNQSIEITLQPVENDAVSAPGGGVLGLANLVGNRYQATTADGVWAEVEVSYESLRKLQEIFQAVLSSFSWSKEGPEVHFPVD